MLLGAVLASSCLADRTLQELTMTPLGPGGGIAHSPDGLVALSVAAGAIAEPVTISIEEDRSQIGRSAFGGTQVSPIYRTGPAGLTLSRTSSLTARYTGNGALLLVTIADDGTSAAVDGSIQDPSTGVVTAPVRQLASWVLVVRPGDASIGWPGVANGPDGGPSGTGAFCSPSTDGGEPFGNGLVIYPCSAANVTPNDSLALAQATGLVADTAVDIAITWTGGDDYYEFEIPEGQRASLHATTHEHSDLWNTCPAGFQVGLALLDGAGGEIASANGASSSLPGCADLNYYVDGRLAGLGPGRYYLRARGSGSSPSSYHLTIFLLGPDAAPTTADGGIYGGDY
jgi:hypothetical protein